MFFLYVCVQGRAVVSEGHVSVASAPCEHEECSILALPAQRRPDCLRVEPGHGEALWRAAVLICSLWFYSALFCLLTLKPFLFLPSSSALLYLSAPSVSPFPQVRCQSPSERHHVLDHLESQLSDFLSDSKESSLFTAAERRELEKEVHQALQHCQDLLVNMETGETGFS